MLKTSNVHTCEQRGTSVPVLPGCLAACCSDHAASHEGLISRDNYLTEAAIPASRLRNRDSEGVETSFSMHPDRMNSISAERLLSDVSLSCSQPHRTMRHNPRELR